MKNGPMIMIIVGFFAIFWQLLPVLHGELMPNVFILWGGILLIIIGLYINKGYPDKNYFRAMFIGIAVWGLLLLYIFLFRPDEYLKGNTYTFYIMLGFFLIAITIRFGRYYIHMRKRV